jgi:hypothetical protein
VRKFLHWNVKWLTFPHFLHAPRASSTLEPVRRAKARSPWKLSKAFCSSIATASPPMEGSNYYGKPKLDSDHKPADHQWHEFSQLYQQ